MNTENMLTQKKGVVTLGSLLILFIVFSLIIISINFILEDLNLNLNQNYSTGLNLSSELRDISSSVEQSKNLTESGEVTSTTTGINLLSMGSVSLKLINSFFNFFGNNFLYTIMVEYLNLPPIYAISLMSLFIGLIVLILIRALLRSIIL